MKKEFEMKAKTSYPDAVANIKFIYNDTTTICILNDSWGDDYKGVAKLSEDDEYDPKIGESISLNKALSKMLNARRMYALEQYAYITKRMRVEEECILKRVTRMQKKFYKE